MAPEKPSEPNRVAQTMEHPPYKFEILENSLPADETYPYGHVEQRLAITRVHKDQLNDHLEPTLKAVDARDLPMDYCKDRLHIELYDSVSHRLFLTWEQDESAPAHDAALLIVDAETGKLDVLAQVWWANVSLELSPNSRYLLSHGYAHESAMCCHKWELIDLKSRSHVYLDAGSQDSDSSSDVQLEQEKRRYRWLSDGRLQLETQIVVGEKPSDQVWRLLQTLLPRDPSLAWKPLSK